MWFFIKLIFAAGFIALGAGLAYYYIYSLTAQTFLYIALFASILTLLLSFLIFESFMAWIMMALSGFAIGGISYYLANEDNHRRFD